MKAYGFASDYIDWELDGAHGWAYANWAVENEATVFGSSMEKKSDGYVRQEWKNLMEQYHGSK